MTSSINIFFSIPPSPNLSFLHLSFFELSHPTFNLSSFHNLSYPISSFLLSDSASTHLQLPSSLTSNSLLIPTTHPNPHFLSQHNQSSPTSTQVPSPLHFHVFLSINHPMRLPVTLFLSLPPTQHLHLSLTSHPPLLPFQFSLHLLRHRLFPGRFLTSMLKSTEQDASDTREERWFRVVPPWKRCLVTTVTITRRHRRRRETTILTSTHPIPGWFPVVVVARRNIPSVL